MPARVFARFGLVATLAIPVLVGNAVPAAAHQAAAPKNVGALACPVGAGRTITNSFGDSRGGGRSHQGVDIMAPYGTPIYAVEGGRIAKAYSNRRGGLSIFLQAPSGVQYFYAHQSANLVNTGQQVAAGQLIGRVGTSGNASGSAPHLHFEKLIAGRRPVDPYGLVRSACG